MGARDQVEVGGQGTDAPSTCAYVGSAGDTGTLDVTIDPPPSTGAGVRGGPGVRG